MPAQAPQDFAGDANARVVFFKELQAVTTRIHATANIDEIMLELSGDICRLFNCDRLTIYVIGEDKQSIVSKVKTGLNSFRICACRSPTRAWPATWRRRKGRQHPRCPR